MDTRIEITLKKIYTEDPQRYVVHKFCAELGDKILFEIGELEHITAIFSFDSTYYSIEIEDYLTGDLKQIKSGEEFELSYGNEDKGNYFPGQFLIRITSDNNSRDYFFQVNPTRVEYQGLLQLRNYVNNFYQGLSLNLFKRWNKGRGFGDEELQAGNKILLALTQMGDLMNYVNQYLIQKPGESKKINTISNAKGKISFKTVQWLTTKGMISNKNINDPEKVMIQKVSINYDNPENQLFKSELLFWNGEIGHALIALQNSESQYFSAIADYEKELTEKSKHLKDIEAQKMVSKQIEKNNQRRIAELRNLISNYQMQLDLYQEAIKKLRHYKTNIEYILFYSWINQVELPKEMVRKVSNPHLRLIVSIRQQYLGMKKNQNPGSNKELAFAEKGTPKLFETFLYIVLIKMFLEEGYSPVNIDIKKDDLAFTLSNASMFSLEKDNARVDIIYDTELKRSDESDGNQYVYINSQHHRPDFIVSFTNNDDVVRTVIVEAKWRPLSAIYNRVDDTEVTRSLRDYLMLGYRQKGSRRVRKGVVSKVIAVYPDFQERFTEIAGEDIYALGVIPQDNIATTSGYQNLKNMLLADDVMLDE